MGVLVEFYETDTGRLVNSITYPDLVPSEVTAAQAQVALFDAGLLDQVEALIESYPYPRVRIWWRSAKAWQRDNPYIYALALELDPPLSDDQVDTLFITAGKVEE